MTENPENRKKKIVEFCNSREQIIELEAIELLSKEEHWEEIIEQITLPIISGKEAKEKLMKHESKLGNVKEEITVKRRSVSGLAKDIDPDYRIMEEYDITGKSSSEGKVKDFLEYFTDKYQFLSSLFGGRVGFNPKTFDKLKSVQKYGEVDVIGMVVKKWVSKNGNTTIELDSPEGRCIVIVSKDDVAINKEADKLLIDDVIGIKGKKFADEVLIAKSFLWPDLMQKSAKYSERDLSLGLISDIHVGSKLFMEKEFSRFLSWLNGNTTSEKEAERVGKIKYLFIAGDNVDGIGIYPDQYDELEIRDIYAQYEKLSELLAFIPEHIEVFICPGQHDAVRRADPQPAIQREYLKGLGGNIHFIGSPGWVEIEGLKVMVYHGASFHDMIANTKHLNYKEPEKAMVELLKRRDISTGFGLTQPYVPEKKDYMVIREEPDFYLGGDMHIKGYTQYRGCLCANAGCWQERTEFQVKEGHIPTPGIALDINLKTRAITENNFTGITHE